MARKEWRRLAKPLYDMGVLSTTDRAAFAAYCQAWARWVEAEEQLKKTPALLKTPSGYVQQSPWLAVANKQLEIMGRYMAELGLTPSARNRVPAMLPSESDATTVTIVYRWADDTDHDADGRLVETKSPLTIDGDLVAKL